jgi:hypothetical protein
MKKKSILASLLAAITIACLAMFAGCFESYTQSDKEYWFSSVDKTFVKYDDTTRNLDEAGTVWTLVSNYTGNVTLSLIINGVNLPNSYAYLFLNGTQVGSENDTGVYTFVYKLSLTKGDTIKIHTYWLYGILADDTECTFSYFVMDDGTGNYMVTNMP